MVSEAEIHVREMRDEVANVLQELDEIAVMRDDEGKFRSCQDRLRKLLYVQEYEVRAIVQQSFDYRRRGDEARAMVEEAMEVAVMAEQERQVEQQLRADLEYFDAARVWARAKLHNEQAACMAEEAASRIRLILAVVGTGPRNREYFDPLDYCPGGIDAG